MLRVGLVCPYSLSFPGGVQGQVLGLARVLRAQGVEARVLAPCDGPPPASFVTPLGNSIPTAANGSMAPIAPDPSAALRTLRALLDEDFDVLHLHEPFAPGPTMTALVLRLSPVLGTFHLSGRSTAYATMPSGVRACGRRLQHAVAVSEQARAMVQQHLDIPCEVLFNGVELDRFDEPRPRPTEGPTIFFCARHEPRKGLDVLLEAMAGLGPEVRLWVASDGPDTSRLRSEYAGDPRITWMGRISDAEKGACLAGADVFCAPSLGGESFGVVLVEAMAAGAVTVASDLPGYRTVARPGVDSLLVPPGEVAPLTEALRRALSDRALAERLRAAGRARAKEFSMDVLAEQYLERYERLAALRTPHDRAGVSRIEQVLRRIMQPA